LSNRVTKVAKALARKTIELMSLIHFIYIKCYRSVQAHARRFAALAKVEERHANHAKAALEQLTAAA
jgi:rubrerythrin